MKGSDDLFPVLDLGKIVKDAVQKQDMLAWQYNTVGVSDAITMGGEGRLRWLERGVSFADGSRHAVFAADA